VPAARRPRLYVDLDGTLIRTDLLAEGFAALAARAPHRLLAIPAWLLRGKAYLKTRLADQVTINAARLPYHEELLAYLRAERAAGRRLVLASGSPRAFVEHVAAHVGIFDAVMATEPARNLTGKVKRDAIVAAEDGAPFDYVGNGPDDLPVWEAAAGAICVGASARTVRLARARAEVVRVFGSRGSRLVAAIKALRVHQWLKNMLLFVPLATSHKIGNAGLALHATIAFLAFSCTASAVYVVNDVLDLEADRNHPRKRDRPFASGALPLSAAGLLVPTLLAAAVALSWILPAAFLGMLGLYGGMALAYSLLLKRVVLLDALTLAGLYTMRVMAGAEAVNVAPSFWLLAFSMFVFLSLALVKRASEVIDRSADATASGRDYGGADLPTITMLGTSSGYLAVLVLALYINSDDVSALYAHPQLLWFLCPILLYWIGRTWIVTTRGQMHHDPVVFALRDPVSWAIAVVGASIVLLAS